MRTVKLISIVTLSSINLLATPAAALDCFTTVTQVRAPAHRVVAQRTHRGARRHIVRARTGPARARPARIRPSAVARAAPLPGAPRVVTLRGPTACGEAAPRPLLVASGPVSPPGERLLDDLAGPRARSSRAPGIGDVGPIEVTDLPPGLVEIDEGGGFYPGGGQPPPPGEYIYPLFPGGPGGPQTPVTGVPEPTAWVMLTMGFAGLGAALRADRRRRRAQAA